MAMNYLADTNIFLEVLLNQSKAETCKTFLQSSTGTIFISDFSLHSIGVILFRKNKSVLFKNFILDIQKGIPIKVLSFENYPSISTYSQQYNLDFDDAYQLSVASEFKLTIKTIDRDFEKVKGDFSIEFQ
jgi:predicted nucleic acid-binding protein